MKPDFSNPTERGPNPVSAWGQCRAVGLTLLPGLGFFAGALLLIAAAIFFTALQDDSFGATSLPSTWSAYLRRGQWHADARTAVAMLRYVLSAEPDDAPRGLATIADVVIPQVAVSTNPPVADWRG
jgi:hypothetical protein